MGDDKAAASVPTPRMASRAGRRGAIAAFFSRLSTRQDALRVAASTATGSSVGPLFVVLIVFVAVLGIFWAFKETLIQVGSSSASTDPYKPQNKQAQHPQHPRFWPSAAAAGTSSTGNISFVPCARPSIVTSTSAPTVHFMPIAASMPSMPVASAPALGSAAALSASYPPARPQLAMPERPSILSTREHTSAPSPRRLAGLALLRPGMERKLVISDPALWSHMEAYFRVPIAFLPAEAGSTGDFDILRGVSQETAFRASVAATPPIGKRVFSLSVPGRDGHLATISPAPGASSMLGGQVVEPCSMLQIQGKDGGVWGTLQPMDTDRYSVQKAGERLLTMEGNQEDGCLVVFLEGEPIAHAARSHGSKFLEVGVKPSIDPILMLACILAVVIFNPTEAATPAPTLQAMSQGFYSSMP